MGEDRDMDRSMLFPVFTGQSGILTGQMDTGLSRPVTITNWYNASGLYDTTVDPLGGYQYPSLYSTIHIALSSVVVTVIMLVIVAGNVLVMVAVAVDRNLKGTQNWFIASLAVSDLLVGLFIMPLSLANELMGYWPFGDVLCQLWLSTDVLLCTASILNLVLISLDRYWSITKAVSYVRGRTRRRAVVMIAVVWLLSMVICLPPLVGWKRPQPKKFDFPMCVLSEEPGYVVYSTVGSFYLPLIVMVTVYFKIYLVARSHARRHRKKYVPNANGMSNFSVANTTNNYASRNPSQRRYPDDNSRISQIPEISSDLSNSIQMQDPDQDPGFSSAETCAAQTSGREESAHLASAGAPDRTTPCRHLVGSDTTDSQGDTPTRFLLPNARRTNLPAVSELGDSPASESSSGGLTTTSSVSRRRRAKSLPGGSNAGGRGESPGSNASLSGIARHLWQSRSHRNSPSRPIELADRRNQTAIPTIKINNDSKGSDASLEPRTRAEALSLFRPPRAYVSSRGQSRSTPPSSEGVDAQQRQRRKMARMKERRATLILGIVMASFVGCWLPFFSLYPISLLAGFEVPPSVFAFIFWLGYINSALNPIIYTIFNREFRQAFKRLLCGSHRKR